MKFFRQIIFGTTAATFLLLPAFARADVNTNAVPDFKEVYDLIRTHLAGESETDLNRDAVQGLLHQLHSKVTLVGNETASSAAATNAALMPKSALYDGPVAYLRVGRVGEGLPNLLSNAFKELSHSNRLRGVVLDLRFADGHDYEQAAAVANLFISKEKPLLDWGHGPVQSKANSDAITLPLAVLVNQETTAAAEALAAMLRDDDRAILLGSNTAGEATMSQDYTLKDGRVLRIATASVKLGNGETLSTKGLQPDIQVTVKPDDERAYYADPFRELPSSMNLIASILGESSVAATNGTNRPARPRQINEAELIRERKERPGEELDGSVPSGSGREPEVEKPVVRDPVLGRALDLVKGISVIHRPRGS